ncbi:hypothetical protein HPB50_004894 [Hyalomma asiaticum]|uniref:Uncharacterized protein n=1 Tax=Hyalomma asiaticum TaxID=266040 RepID=A0ACB7SCC8_HYAAI|nr:hypothetical protein HPB50_004894 [Hyalomma asiaticum]
MWLQRDAVQPWGFSSDLDLHIGKMAQQKPPTTVINKSVMGPSEDTQGSATRSDGAQATVTESILELPNQQDIAVGHNHSTTTLQAGTNKKNASAISACLTVK